MNISVITPTRNRVAMLWRLVHIFLQQTVVRQSLEVELVIVYDFDDYDTVWAMEAFSGMPNVKCVGVGPMSVGEKINIGMAAASGDIIAFMDDDDVFVDDWLERSAGALVKSGADVVGLNKIYFYKPEADELYRYLYPEHLRPYVAGGTFCFWKKYWEGHKFEALNVGYDNNFIFNKSCKVVPHGYHDRFVATIHTGNVCQKRVKPPRWEKVSPFDRLRMTEGMNKLLEQSRALQELK
jgi:glycosyltransferase involved in cell wall biosynthesis